ncbi:MAG: tetratricopeptide repeat protein [Planctomycetota bacterium]
MVRSRRRFVEYYAQEAESIMIGTELPRPIEAVRRGQREHENLLAAIEASLSGDVTPRGRAALEIASALFVFWEIRGFLRSGCEILEQALELDRVDGHESRAPQTVRARALNAAANLHEALGDQERALVHLDECVALCRSIGLPSKQGVVLVNTAISLRRIARTDEARSCYAEALEIAEREGDLKLEGLVRLNLSILQRESGDVELGLESLRRAREIAEKRGDVHSLAYCESSLGLSAIDQGDDDEAEARLTRAREGFAEIGDVPSVARTTSNLSLIASRRGDHARAEELLREALRSHRQTGSRRGEAIALVNLVPNAAEQLADRPDRFERGRLWLAECAEILIDLGEPRVSAYAMEAAATLRAAMGEIAAAVEFAAAATEHRKRVERPMSQRESEQFEATLEEWRSSLGTGPFEDSRSRGAAWGSEEALRKILHWSRGE